MNIDRIIQLGIESKFLHESETKEYIFECGVEVWISGQRGLDALEKFANLISEHEREACAMIVEESSLPDAYSQECMPDIANDIRARGQA